MIPACVSASPAVGVARRLTTDNLRRKDFHRIAASLFAILMAIANLGTGIGMALSSALVDAVDYRLTFAIVSALNLLALPLMPAIFGRAKRQLDVERV